MRRCVVVLALVLLCLVCFAPSAFATPIIINGSFEIGPTPQHMDDDIPIGSSALVGWTVFGTVSIDWLNPPWNVSDGIHAIDLDGRNSFRSGVSQSFETEVGKEYQVQFDLSGNPDGGPSQKEVRVAVGDFTQNFQFNLVAGQSISSITWETITFTFRATDTASVLSFTSWTPAANSYGALIDNVRVNGVAESVPDPGLTLLLLGIGFAGLGACRKRWK